MAAGLILLALMASLVLSRARTAQPRCPVYVLIETDMVLVELEPQTFEVKLDREFLYWSPCPTVLARPPVNLENYQSKQPG
jgi:hypothetical protein